MKKIWLLVLLLFISITSFTNEIAEITSMDSALSKSGQEVLKEAYGRLNYDVKFVILPGKRALSDSNSGKYFAENIRIKGIEKKFPNLVMVPVAITYFELRAYSKKHNLVIKDKKDLEGYSIGYKNGVVIAENYSKGLKTETSPDDVINFKKLNAGRLDIVLAVDVNGNLVIKNNNYTDIKVLEPALVKVNLYHYVHKDNMEIVPKLTEVLKMMEASGEIERIRSSVLK